MDKKLYQKSSNFFKKEGFYIILFVCLCIVATAAVLVSKSKTGTPLNTQKEAQNVKQTPQVAEVPNEEIQNALEVKKNSSSDQTAQNSSSNATTTQSSVAATNNTTTVSTKVDESFAKPVAGTIVRSYSEDPVLWKSSSNDTSTTYRPNFGIDIKAQLGAPVVSVMDGIVKDITSGEDGIEISIYHPQDGLKTIYSNLDAKVSVTKGQSVKKGATIGKVGETSVRAAYEDYGKDYLHFSVQKDSKYIDPVKYVKY